MLTLIVMIHLELSPEVPYYFILVCYVILHDIIPLFILPTLLLWRLKSKLPELFIDLPRRSRKPRRFYVRDLTIFPRRDFQGSPIGDIKCKIYYIEVKPYS